MKLPETNSHFAPKDGGFQARNLRTSRGPLFSGSFAVSFREGNSEFTPEKWWERKTRQGFLLGQTVTFQGASSVKLREGN